MLSLISAPRFAECLKNKGKSSCNQPLDPNICSWYNIGIEAFEEWAYNSLGIVAGHLQFGGTRIKSDYISRDDVGKLAMLMPYGYREIVLLAADTGYRIGDICTAPRSAYDGAQKITLQEQKTGKSRTVAAPEWLAEYDRQHDPYRPYLITVDGKRADRTTVWRWIKRARNELFGDMARQISPHSLRKCYAVGRRMAGDSLPKIQENLNHDNAATTLLYAYADLIDECPHA